MIILLKASVVKYDEVLEGAVLCPEGLPGVLRVSKSLRSRLVTHHSNG